jgi:hypothetical protein
MLICAGNTVIGTVVSRPNTHSTEHVRVSLLRGILFHRAFGRAPLSGFKHDILGAWPTAPTFC